MGTFQSSPPPKKGKEKEAYGDLVIETHEGTVTWYAPLKLAPSIDPATLRIAGTVYVLACDAKNCHPPRNYAFTALLGRASRWRRAGKRSPAQRNVVASPPHRLAAARGRDRRVVGPGEWQPFTTIEDLKRLNRHFDPETMRAFVLGRIRGKSAADVAWAVLVGFLGGLILNVMPCVLPVIGLKVLSFVEQAGHDRRRALVLNVWYSVGLLAVFVVLATLAVSPQKLGWGQLFGMPGFTITLAAVVFVMGLSFLGVWEVPIPGFAGRGKASELAAQEGAAGAFVKGALTTVMATPCSAPAAVLRA